MTDEPVITLTVAFNPRTRRCEVTGPLDNTVLCLGMLAEAGRIVERRADLRDEASEHDGGPQIVVARNIPPM